MFTGIVESTGTVTERRERPDGMRLRIDAPFTNALDSTQSISVDGTCLTVESHDGESFEVFLASETINRTTLGDLSVGDPVNLERAMSADGRFDGHIVQGHIDATTEITGVESIGEDWMYEFALPDGLEKYISEKGSIALDGISLTVADRHDGTFSIAIVPTTYEETTLSEKGVGDRVNVEIDIIAKYVEQLCE